MTTSLLRRKISAPQPELEVTAPVSVALAGVITLEAIAFLAALERRFGARRRELLAARTERQRRLDAGLEQLDFQAETAGIREGKWSIAPAPVDLLDRRVEIIGPADRPTLVAALNSGAQTFVADFEDSFIPSWTNLLQGQIDLYDAVRRRIAGLKAVAGKTKGSEGESTTLIVRPRGWHMEEAHVRLDGAPISAALFDFGLYLFHNARELLRRGSGPYFCLPKIENRHEAALWRDVFAEAEALLNLPVGAIRATVIIETLPAAFEMDEILYELRDRATSLACGRRDYLFSMIKVLGACADFIVPEYAGVTMTSPALRAFSRLLVTTCRRRGAQAIGAVAAQRLTPCASAANEAVLIKVSADKAREAGEGYDGISVAHPELAPAARAAFDAARGCAKTVCLPDEAVTVGAADLLTRPEGRITEPGVREAIRVAIRTIEAWLRGRRCEPLNTMIEDAAAAEVRRAQVWQWRRHGVQLDGGEKVDADMIIRMAREETAAFRDGEFPGARKLFLGLCLSDELKPFLTTAAYPCLLAAE